MNAARWQKMADAVDREAAETFIYQPMSAIDVNARPTADPGRAAQNLIAIWAAPSVESNRRPRLDMAATRQGSARQVSSERPTIKFQTAALPYGPAIGDRVTRALTGEVLQVGEVNADGFGRTILGLTARSSSGQAPRFGSLDFTSSENSGLNTGVGP